MKKLWTGIMITAVMAVAVQASTIVQLGARDGTTTMLTATDTGPKLSGDYDATRIFTPPAVDSGYNGQKFAATTTKGQNNNWTDGGTGFDYVQVLANMGKDGADDGTGTGGVIDGFYEGMLAWDGGANGSGQSAFLTSDTDLESFHIEFKARGTATPTTVSFLLQTTDGWYTTQSTTEAAGVWTSFDLNIGSATWAGFSQFGVTDGTIAEAVADTSDIVSVGFYLDATNDGSNGFSGGMVRNFEVTAIPEPATMGLVASFGVGVLFIRRRLMM